MDSPGPRPCHHELMGGRDSSGLGAGKVAAEEQRNALTPEKVLAEALVIVQREGLTALTMRRLAAELGVRAPTVYWHVGNRQELLTRLARRLTDELGNIQPKGDNPAERISSLLQGLRAEIRSRPHLIELLAAQGRGRVVLIKAEELVARELVAGGLRGKEAARAFNTLMFNFGGFLLLDHALSDDYRIRGARNWEGANIDDEMRRAVAEDVDCDEIYGLSVEAILAKVLPQATQAKRAPARRTP